MPGFARAKLLFASGLFSTFAATALSAAPAAHAAPSAIFPTFSKEIAPILFQNCAECHRPGEVGPFPLLHYEDARKRARTIAKVVEKRYMPPWKADPDFGEFHDVRRLTEAQIQLIKQWVAEGAPEGNPADLPPTPPFPTGWSLGEPDVVFEMPESYTLAAEGRDVYRCFVLPTGFTEDKFVSAVELRPGNRAVVHHVIAYVDTTGRARQLEAADPDPGYHSFGGTGISGAEWLEGWAPGKNPRHLPAGFGKLVPQGADLILQVHYNQSGKPETDRTRIGLYFCREPVDKRVRVSRLSGQPLRIPAGEPNHVVRASMNIPANVTVLEVFPHMHLLGREMTVTAKLPDDAAKPMVRISDWDFNWQLGYAFKEPLSLPRGSQIQLTARFDNSAANPSNPNHPPRLVTWGEQTTDEMCIAFFNYTVDAESLVAGMAGSGLSGRPRLNREALLKEALKRFDKNGDGVLDPEERAEALRAFRERPGANR